MALLSQGTYSEDEATGSYSAACDHLTTVDPILGELIRRIGRCTLLPRSNGFLTLCDSIIAQQLSPAAATIFDRFRDLYPTRRPTASAVLVTPIRRLRRAGLSSQKATAIKALAQAWHHGHLRRTRLHRASNERIIEQLVMVRGIGRWTAEMFLIFCLNRLDVLPVDDRGIRKAVMQVYGLRAVPTAVTLRRLARTWRPYETLACWYLWRSLERGSVQMTSRVPTRLVRPKRGAPLALASEGPPNRCAWQSGRGLGAR